MAFIQGTFSYPGATGWLEQGASSGLAVYGSHVESAWEMEFLGGVGDNGYYLFFDAVKVSSSPCGHHTGSFGLRDPNGGWYWWDKTTDCDECGALSFNDENMGTLCLDMSEQFAIYADQMRVP
jgi:hypothetical protein